MSMNTEQRAEAGASSPAASIGPTASVKSAQQALADEYRLRFESAASYRRKVWEVLCRSYFSKIVGPGASLLDVGCGWGEFINNVEARAKYAMDLNPEAGSRLATGIQFFHQDCSRAWPLQAASLDIVFSSNFLEHLPDKAAIDRALAEAYRVLKPSGKIVLLGPNVRFLAAEYWDFWDHHIAISDRSLAESLALTGFTVTKQIARFLPYTMSEGRKPPLLFVEAYLAMPWLWPLFGKQFLVVAEKPCVLGLPAADV